MCFVYLGKVLVDREFCKAIETNMSSPRIHAADSTEPESSTCLVSFYDVLGVYNGLSDAPPCPKSILDSSATGRQQARLRVL